MNGIILRTATIEIGSTAEFLFSPEVGQRAIPAIIEFLGGQKAYAEIYEVLPKGVIIKVGEYSTDQGEKITVGMWHLRYDKRKNEWKIVENLLPS
ncbi:hypothetical protein JI747_011235 [Chryseobacterium sp. RG1]|uniref:DUF4440 domain-containing protein n=1 Tax=Chryseobacterium tagetis TaxID=2801334 RepID=A0ABS8A186_9FLAO|nr:hypothetical protein [Chryseobacterium tagetis]MCA6067754.1 hypothetical protein [Chryseobacterium tagetis]